jgi:hypothetical protein
MKKSHKRVAIVSFVLSLVLLVTTFMFSKMVSADVKIDNWDAHPFFELLPPVEVVDSCEHQSNNGYLSRLYPQSLW